MQLVADKNWPQANLALQAIIRARTFRRLPEDVQYRTLRTAEQVAVQHGSARDHYDYFVRTTALPQATFDDWRDRLAAADRMGNKAEVAHCLTVLVQRWPDQAVKFNPDRIQRTLHDAESVSREAAFSLSRALYDAHWKLKGDLEPSGAWRALTLLLLEKVRLADAIEVSGHVTAVYDLIAMRVDRRFDAVVAANPAHFDIVAATDREMQALQAASEGTPDSLELKSNVIEALLSRQHYEAALAASDAVLLDIRSTNFTSQLFKDYDDHASWFFDLRSIALERVGRWDEAVTQLEAASQLKVRSGRNINQLINLGDLYCDFGRPKDALAALDRVGSQTSALGAMEVESVRLDAASQLGDAAQVARSLSYLHSHRADAPIAYVFGLSLVNDFDRAAEALIAQLADKNQRQDALSSVQDWAAPPGPPGERHKDIQWQTLIARRDVQAAIHRVGRVESYRLEGEIGR